DLLPYAKAESGALTERERFIKERGRNTPRKDDDLLAGQSFNRQTAGRGGKAMVPRDRRDQGLGHDFAVCEPAARYGPGQKADIQRAPLKLRQLLIRHQFAQLKRDEWMTAPELAQEGRQEAVFDGSNEADRQRAMLSAGAPLHEGASVIDLRKDPACLVEQERADPGQRDVPVIPVK